MQDLVTRFSHRLDMHQSTMHARALQGIGWKVFGKPGSQIFLRQLGPVSTAKMQRPNKVDLAFLKSFRKQHKTFGFYLEPGPDCTIKGGSRLGFHVEPFSQSKTSLVDLSPIKEEIIKSFSQKTRYNINYTLKKDLVKIKSFSLSKLAPQASSDFFQLRSDWSKRKSVYGYEENFLKSILTAYKDHGWIHLAYIDGVAEATLLTLTCDHVGIYYSAFSSIEGYHHFAPTLLTWQSMLTCKKNDCDIYDFGGIYDPRYPKMYKKWQGFTKFKDGFHPTYVEYPETHLQLFW